jgi:LysM repeat protein
VAAGAETAAPRHLWEIDDYALSAEPLIIAGDYNRARGIGTEAGGLYRSLAVDVAAGRHHGAALATGAGHAVTGHTPEAVHAAPGHTPETVHAAPGRTPETVHATPGRTPETVHAAPGYTPETGQVRGQEASVIAEYQSTIAELRSTLDMQQRIIADYQNTIAEHRVIIAELRSTIDRQHSVISEFHSIVAELLDTIRETQAMAHQVLRTSASVVDVPSTPPRPSHQALPARYTVRSGDSLWRIAGYPWVYNDPMLWRNLYNANRTRMPQSDNPDLIYPDMILEIPSIRGEAREGMWDNTRVYPTGGIAFSVN